MSSAFLRLIPRYLRQQFSLASLFLLTSASAFGTWYWYQRPYSVEEKVRSIDPVCLTVSPAELAAYNQRPPQFREVQYVRRVGHGKTVKHGPYRAYNLQGNLLRTGSYSNGREHGDFVRYAPGGIKISQQTYIRGELEGAALWWDTKGKLFDSMMYRNGKRHGPRAGWSGSLYCEENYDGGLLHGPFKHSIGTEKKELVVGSFDRGLPSGQWKWLPAGKTIAMIRGQWQEGRATGRWEWRTPDGQLYFAAEFERGRTLFVEP